MGQATLHGDLLSKQFPFLFSELSSTVVLNQGSETQRNVPADFHGEDASQSYGVNQAYFMQNCLPTTRGYSSVHFHKQIAAQVLADVRVDDLYILRAANNSVALYSPAAGHNLVFDAQVGTWQEFPVAGFLSTICTTTVFQGNTYICLAHQGVYQYNFVTQVFEKLSLLGIDDAQLEGIVSAGGYLVLYTTDRILYSDPTNPLNFVPSIGGAGSTSVGAVKSDIVTVLPIADGFIIYTTLNAVAATTTSNPNFPFNFREIPGSSGVSSNQHVSYDSNFDRHIAWTSSGFQLVTMKQATNVWMDLSDSLARNLLTVADNNQAWFPIVQNLAQTDVKVNIIGARFICVSVRDLEVSPYEFQMAYVYDSALDRWGRIDIPHSDLLQYSAPDFAKATSYDDLEDGDVTYDMLNSVSYDTLDGYLLAKASKFGENFGIVNAFGEVFNISLAKDNRSNTETPRSLSRAAEPQLLLGRYKITRDNGVQCQWFNIDEVIGVDSRVYSYAHDYNGDFCRAELIQVKDSKVRNRFYNRLAGDGISIGIFVKFNITNLVGCFSDIGRRNLPPRVLYVPPVPDYGVMVNGVQVVVNGILVVATP